VFVQTTTSSRKNGKTYVSYLVRESFRTPDGPRSRTICNITDLPVPTRDLIVASLKGQDFLPADQVQLHEALDYGGLAVLNDAWSRFRLGELMFGLGSPRQRGLLQAVIYTEGLPLHVSVLRGNRNDTQTLQGLLHTLRRRLGIQEATFVFDGGMSSQVNLEAMNAAHLGYVTRLSAATLQSLVEALALEKRMELGDRQQLMEITCQGKRYVIAGGPWRQQRDQARRQSRIDKAEAEFTRLAAVKRKKVDVQKLASQAGRSLQRLKAHKYFTYHVDVQGHLQWERKGDLIAQEAQQDGWYLLHTNESLQKCPAEQVLGHYKGLLDVEEAFCELKSYLEVRPIHHRRPDRVVNHVRLCFLAYWLSARLGAEWRAKGETEEVPRVLRHLQTIRLGRLQMGPDVYRTVMTEVPKNINEQLQKLGLAPLFASPPKR
jgi:transposase